MRVHTTVPVSDPKAAGPLFQKLESIGYDGAFTYESKHDPFLPLAVAADRTKKIALGTAIAIGFARNPMNLANLGYDLQVASEGRFALGLGSQVRPHIQKRFSSTWSAPAPRMRELVLAIRAIWDAWEGNSKLDFRGEFFTHTLMIPAFDPGPNPYGPPRILTAGVGPKMIEVAGEVADGLLAHPFNTAKSTREILIPALERGFAKSGRRRENFDLTCVLFIVTADTEEQFEQVKSAARGQLSFYGSTPAYKATLECHGWGDLHVELNRMSKQGRWDDMSELITDEIMETIAVVGPRESIAPQIIERVGGIADAVSIENTRHPDPAIWADVVAHLKRLG